MLMHRSLLIIFLCCFTLPVLAALQVSDGKPGSEFDPLFSTDKKPCDADAKKTDQKANAEKAGPSPASQVTSGAQLPSEPHPSVKTSDQAAADKAVQGLMNLGILPADQSAAADRKPLGMPQPPMGHCN